MNLNEVTLNWHITEQCNYKCYYCFAKYEKCKNKEIHTSRRDTKMLLSKLYCAMQLKYQHVPLRLNIAGGEPLLLKDIGSIIECAGEIGFRVSMISNASLLSNEFIKQYAHLLCMFGVSIDSAKRATNEAIGRFNKNCVFDTDILKDKFSILRQENKHIQIKINSVVNAYNYTEDLSDLIESIQPDKWKVFQALSINTDRIFCTMEQFEYFLATHKKFHHLITDESNSLMTNSYIMLDPFGRFYQNKGGAYSYSKVLLRLSNNEIADCISVDMEQYAKRYVG